MNKLFLTIVLCIWALSVHAQDDGEVSTTQTLASLLDTQPEKKAKEADESVAISFGSSSVKSKIYSSGDEYSGLRGMDLMVEYDYIYPKGFGFGITIAFNRTKVEDILTYQLFAGPSLAYAGYLGKKFWAKVDLGLGYANFFEKNSMETGLGGKSSVSFDFMVKPNIGIGVQLSTFSTYFGKSSDDEIKGIVRYGLSVNMRMHI